VFHVTAFTANAATRAAVCPLTELLDDACLGLVAAENNLSRTAYFVPKGDYCEFRRFTPGSEVSLCEHATLAPALVILQILAQGVDAVRFETR
jgi:PhzF family phenazine biosynthesis protein